MARYLIVANQTLGGEHLMDEVRRRIASGSAEFHVLVPTPARALGFADAVSSQGGLVISDFGAHGDSAAQERRDEAARHRVELTAQSRLAQLLNQIRDAGATAQGEIGGSDPVEAVGPVLSQRGPFSEIIVSTLPLGASRWLRTDVPHRLERRYKLPVTTVTAKG